MLKILAYQHDKLGSHCPGCCGYVSHHPYVSAPAASRGPRGCTWRVRFDEAMNMIVWVHQ